MTTTTRVMMFSAGATLAVVAFCALYMASAFGGLAAGNPASPLADQLCGFLGVVVVASVGTFPLLTGGFFLCVKAVCGTPFVARTLRHLAISVLLTIGVHLLLTLPVMGAIGLSWAKPAAE